MSSSTMKKIWSAGIASIVSGILWLQYKRHQQKRIESEMEWWGTIEPGYEEVLKSFLQNFKEEREAVAQLCCYVDGKCVLNLTGKQRKSDEDGLVVQFSVTKFIESYIFAILADRGLIQFDMPVAHYWPGFGKAVSPKVTIADLLKHQGGVSALTPPVTFVELQEILNSGDALKSFLEKNQCEYVPTSPPSRQHYHAVTRGFYLDVLVYITTGKRISEFFDSEVMPAIKRYYNNENIHCYIGCPDEVFDRVTPLRPIETRAQVGARFFIQRVLPGPLARLFISDIDLLKDFELDLIQNITSPILQRAFRLTSDRPSDPILFNNHEVMKLPVSSTTGVSDAYSLGAIGNFILSENELLSSKGLKRALQESGSPLFDEILRRTLRFCDNGWCMDRFEAFGGKGQIGWAGVGGSILLINPELRTSFAYSVSGLQTRMFKARGVRILKSFQEAVQQLKEK